MGHRALGPLRAAALLALGATGCTPAPLAPGDPALPDVVLVSIDTLRADHLGSYGYERDTTPFIDELARRGLRWEHARSPSPWTLPAHVTLLSGALPHHHLAVEDDLGIPAELPLLPERMKARGFATAGFVSTLFVSRKYGFERGFDHFDDGDIKTSKQNLAGEVTATDVVDGALKWLRRREAGEPAFLFLHFYDAHYAYDPPAPFDTMFDRAPEEGDATYKTYFHHKKHPLDQEQLAHQIAQYDEAIRYVDSELARLHAAMEQAGRGATWVVTSDHGEEFGERGSWGHAHTLYPEQLRVPLVMGGERLPTTGVVRQVVGLEDIAPSIAALVGAELPAKDGRPLALDPAAETDPERRFLAETSRFSTQRAGLWQEGYRVDIDAAGGTRELYHSQQDPHEQREIARQEAERVSRLEATLWQQLGAPWECGQAGRVSVRQGHIVQGALGSRALDCQVGERFAVFPLDAEIRHSGADTRYRAGESLPEPGAPLAWHGAEARAVQLSPEQRAQLEALGYIQGDEGSSGD